MALTRALSRRSLSLLTLPSICVRGMQSVKETKQAPADEEDDSLSTTTSPSLGWLRGPDANKPNKSVEDEWEELRDAQTGAVSWRSIMTGETTVPGAPKPHTWVEVVDKKTGLIYFWCKLTGETTVLGEPKPGPYGRRAQFDSDEAHHLEEGGGRRGTGSRQAEGPSLMRLVANPLVIGVSAVAVLGIAYESFFK